MQSAYLAQAESVSVSWIDWTALAVLTVFLVAGLFRGVIWQLTRTGILVLAYLIAIVVGPHLADAARELFSTEHDRAHHYLSFAAVFVGVVVLVGLVAWLIRRRVEERPPLAVGNRLVGGVVGLVTGGLIVLALLTGVQMFHDWTGSGVGVARAASDSRSQVVGQSVLRTASRALPAPWAERAETWRELLDDPDLVLRGTFRPLPSEPADGETGERKSR